MSKTVVSDWYEIGEPIVLGRPFDLLDFLRLCLLKVQVDSLRQVIDECSRKAATCWWAPR